MTALFGPVLTHAKTLDGFLDYWRRGGFNAAKVVTGWGIGQGGWSQENKQKILRTIDNLVLRTTAGDPQNPNAGPYLYCDAVYAEAVDWLRIKPDLWVELGNEPDVLWEREGRTEQVIWNYRYWLIETIKRLRSEFPAIRIIAPAPRIGIPGWERWLEITRDVAYGSADAVALHLYGWHTIVGDGKREYESARGVYNRLFPGKLVAVTELGINDPGMPATSKLQSYREFACNAPVNWRWVLFYHYNERRDIHPEYHIPV